MMGNISDYKNAVDLVEHLHRQWCDVCSFLGITDVDTYADKVIEVIRRDNGQQHDLTQQLGHTQMENTSLKEAVKSAEQQITDLSNQRLAVCRALRVGYNSDAVMHIEKLQERCRNLEGDKAYRDKEIEHLTKELQKTRDQLNTVSLDLHKAQHPLNKAMDESREVPRPTVTSLQEKLDSFLAAHTRETNLLAGTLNKHLASHMDNEHLSDRVEGCEARLEKLEADITDMQSKVWQPDWADKVEARLAALEEDSSVSASAHADCRDGSHMWDYSDGPGHTYQYCKWCGVRKEEGK